LEDGGYLTLLVEYSEFWSFKPGRICFGRPTIHLCFFFFKGKLFKQLWMDGPGDNNHRRSGRTKLWVPVLPLFITRDKYNEHLWLATTTGISLLIVCIYPKKHTLTYAHILRFYIMYISLLDTALPIFQMWILMI